MKNVFEAHSSCKKVKVFYKVAPYTTFLQFRYFIDFRCGIAIFADFFCGITVFVDIFCGIAVFGTPQCPPPQAWNELELTLIHTMSCSSSHLSIHFCAFTLVTRRPYCTGRPKELCFTTLSLPMETMEIRLSVVKQSFFGPPGQYGRLVTRANYWERNFIIFKGEAVLNLRWLKRSSGWLESWEGLLSATDVLTTCAEAIWIMRTIGGLGRDIGYRYTCSTLRTTYE